MEITGRLRERILRGGYSVFPQEVEAVLAEHPDVAEAAVVGVPHPELGEEVAAFVVARPGDEPGNRQRGGLLCRPARPLQVPAARSHFVPELPKGPTGKVLKAELLLRLARGERSEGEEP